MRISSPPLKYPCFYGIDISTTKELIAAKMSVEEIREYIGADSLAYLSLDGLVGVHRTERRRPMTVACASPTSTATTPLRSTTTRPTS